MRKVILGIDTSHYRTSLSLADTRGNLLDDQRRWLDVPKGSRGLQPSEAVFQHVQQMPLFMDKLSFQPHELVAVCASTAPRPVPGSYMPVFRVGESFARTLSATLDVPFYSTTHQEGHIAAAEGSASSTPAASSFIAVHLSGGTSELLFCQRKQTGYAIEKKGGTTDLHAGQLIDRLGVALGLSFPAGPHLERLAHTSEGAFSVPSSVRGFDFSFSGPTTALLRALERDEVPHADLARAAEKCIANTLEKVLCHTLETLKIRDVFIVGGVAANAFIRERLKQRLEHPARGARLFFADPVFSGDNAFGVARIGAMQHAVHERSSER